MKSNKYNVLIAAYGGGHVQSLIPVAKELQRIADIDMTVIGFTTARRKFAQAGLAVERYNLFEKYILEPCDELLDSYLPTNTHPDISDEETRAYFHVGLSDLIEEYGKTRALELIEEKGRKAFCPVRTLKRYLADTGPDLVVTSTSPRSELALQRAARELGIQGLAVSDLFLLNEASYICADSYAQHISVIGTSVARFLKDAGCTESKIHLTGNPAFDHLFKLQSQSDISSLKSSIGLQQNDHLITWICESSESSGLGRKFVREDNVFEILDTFCRKNSGYGFAIRPHPNRPSEANYANWSKHILDSRHPVERVIWATDTVILQNSTVGLEAALIGKNVITVGSAEYPPYSSLGLALDVPSIDDLTNAIKIGYTPSLKALGPVGLGKATENVLNLIDQLLGRGRGGVLV